MNKNDVKARRGKKGLIDPNRTKTYVVYHGPLCPSETEPYSPEGSEAVYRTGRFASHPFCGGE